MGNGGRERRSAAATIALHLISATSLTSAYFLVSRHVYGYDLVSHPAQTLRLLLVVQAPIVIGSYSWVRRNPQHCSFLKAVVRGILGLPIGALVNAFGAIVLGAPVGIKYLTQTIYWSLLMSLFNAVPAACVFGLSRMDWQKNLGHSKPTEMVEYMVSLPAYGAVLGAMLGAWPMPLDWERPWQTRFRESWLQETSQERQQILIQDRRCNPRVIARSIFSYLLYLYFQLYYQTWYCTG